MFGASAVRKKREREQREKLARGGEPRIFPYIKPFGPCFDASELPYFKQRRVLSGSEEGTVRLGGWEVGARLATE